MHDNNSIQFTPSPSYPKPQGRGNSTGSNSNSGGYNKSSHRGRGRGGVMNAERNQQGDNRGTSIIKFEPANYQHSKYANIITDLYNCNVFIGGSQNASNNYVAGSYNHYRGRDSRSSWDGSSNSSKKGGGGNYNHHNNQTAGNTTPVYPQSISTTVPSIMNIPTSSVTGYISPQQYYPAGQSTNYINTGAKSEIAANTSQLPALPTSGNNVSALPATGAQQNPSPTSPSGQMSVQIEKVATPVSSLSSGSLPAGPIQNSSSVGPINPGNVIMQSQSATASSNQSPSKPAVTSVLPIQTVSVNTSVGSNVQTTPEVVSTLPQATVVSQQSSNAPTSSNPGSSQRPTRGITDDASNSGGGYHGHNTGYYQNYHQKSSVDSNKDGMPV